MMNVLAEKTLARLLGFGSAGIAIVVITGAVTDPVNVTKLFALGAVATAAIVLTIATSTRFLWRDSKLSLVVVALFLLASFNAIINGTGPLTQSIYGTYGRNTGFIAYALLLMVYLSALALRQINSFRLLIWGLISAGIVNVIYCLWVVVFGDFVPWNNPYGNILGTFGNPNFIGAFLGFFAAAMVAFTINNKLSIWLRLASGLIFLIAFYEIVDSKAIQGRVVVVAGLALIGFYWIRSRFQNPLVQITYIAGVGFAGVVALLGALQIGPLTKYIYKTSVSLRGEYWQAGWNMASDHPLTGIGFDTYGDWYRRARDDQALILPGPDTVTNAAHNVPFDVLASGGWPLFISYLIVIAITLVAVIKVTLRKKAYDPVFVAMTTAWAGYQLQSVISINQIGLAIWGWLFSGALVAYEIATREAVTAPATNERKDRRVVSKKNQRDLLLSPALLVVIGGVIGGLIASPPYAADSKWRTALGSSNANLLESALQVEFLNPATSYKYANAVAIFEQNKLYDLAYKYGKIAVEFNPDHFDSWKLLQSLSKSTPEDRAAALANMKRLDPLNETITG